MRLRNALDRVTLYELRALAEVYSPALPPTSTKYELVEIIARHLTTRANLDTVVGALSGEERTALDRLLAEGGRIIARQFTDEFGNVRPHGSYYVESYRARAAPATPAQGLSSKGLIYLTYGGIGQWSGEFYEIPDEILAMLPHVQKASFKEILSVAHDPVKPDAPGDLMRDIGVFLCYLRREPVKAVRGNQLPKRDLLRLNQAMSRPQDPATIRTEKEARPIAFVHHLASSLGLVSTASGLIGPASTAAHWLQQSRDRQLRDAWHVYQKDIGWIEATEDDTATGQMAGYLFADPQRLVTARARFVDTLKLCPVGKWLSLQSLSSAMKSHAPLFFRVLGNDRQQISPFHLSSYGAWADNEAPLIRTYISETMSAFGVVETGVATAHEIGAVFRLTDIGVVLLGLVKGKIAEPRSTPIVIQPNFEIVVPPEAAPHIVYELPRIAQLAKSDRASIYTLSQEALWRSLQAGDEIEHILAFLEKASERPLPQNVAYSLREWAAKHGQVVIEQVTLLTAASDALMAEIRANKKLGLPVKSVISPLVVTLGEGDRRALVERMKKQGYWPKTNESIVREPDSEGGQGTIVVAKQEILRLLAGAVMLSRLGREIGWSSPISDRLINAIAHRLPPALIKQVQALAAEALAEYEANDDASYGPDGTAVTDGQPEGSDGDEEDGSEVL